MRTIFYLLVMLFIFTYVAYSMGGPASYPMLSATAVIGWFILWTIRSRAGAGA
jgi:hypothetical protein